MGEEHPPGLFWGDVGEEHPPGLFLGDVGEEHPPGMFCGDVVAGQHPLGLFWEDVGEEHPSHTAVVHHSQVVWETAGYHQLRIVVEVLEEEGSLCCSQPV